jgi:site-specific DNA-methyltransferase (adenine-specific)
MNIHIGDCIAVMREMPAESVDLIVADPPYNIGIDYGTGKAADRRQDYPQWCRLWIAECCRLLKPYGSLWIVSGQEYGAHIDLAMQACGLHVRNRITWHETFGVYCHRKFGRTSRPVFYAVKNPRSFTFNADAVTVPSARQTKYNDKRASPGGKIMGDVWEIPRVCGTFRERVPGVPTQLPYELVRRIVLVSSNEGETVLDPFVGSGTVARVAEMHGRVGHGIELNESYAAIASNLAPPSSACDNRRGGPNEETHQACAASRATPRR